MYYYLIIIIVFRDNDFAWFFWLACAFSLRLQFDLVSVDAIPWWTINFPFIKICIFGKNRIVFNLQCWCVGCLGIFPFLQTKQKIKKYFIIPWKLTFGSPNEMKLKRESKNQKFQLFKRKKKYISHAGSEWLWYMRCIVTCYR